MNDRVVCVRVRVCVCEFVCVNSCMCVFGWETYTSTPTNHSIHANTAKPDYPLTTPKHATPVYPHHNTTRPC